MKNFDANINSKYLHSEITAKILQGFYTICNEIGYGIDFEIFKKTLIVEFENSGLKCEANKKVKINYRNIEVGRFTIDILVDNKVNIRLISSERILREHEISLINQLKLSKIEVGLLLNHYIEGEHKRKIYTNDIKNKSKLLKI